MKSILRIKCKQIIFLMDLLDPTLLSFSRDLRDFMLSVCNSVVSSELISLFAFSQKLEFTEEVCLVLQGSNWMTSLVHLPALQSVNWIHAFLKVIFLPLHTKK